MVRDTGGDLTPGIASPGTRVRCIQDGVVHLKKGNIYTVYANAIDGITLKEIFFGSGDAINRPVYKHALFNRCIS